MGCISSLPVRSVRCAKEYLTRISMATPTRPEVSIATRRAPSDFSHEQVDFLRKLYRNELPFKVEHQRLVKDIMIVEAGRD